MTRTGCEGRSVAVRRLVLIVIFRNDEGGRKRRERGGCEGWMGWDLFAVSCANGRGRSDGRKAMSRGRSKVEGRICGRQTIRRDWSVPVLAWLQSKIVAGGKGI